MTQVLEILILEDNPLDAELIVATLQRDGFAFRWKRVQNEADYLSALTDSVDLILSDFQMPGFGALRALDLLKWRSLDIPFIIISGTIGDDVAVDAMRHGANDYLLKDRLARLPAAASRALQDSRSLRERRQMENALRSSEARFRNTLERLMEGCQILDHNWRYLYVNEIAARHGHRKVSELLGRTMPEIYPGVENTPMFAVLKQCLEDGIPRQMENEFTLDGVTAWFQLMIQPVPEGLFVLSLDITERKQADQRIHDQLAELLRWQEAMINREERVLAMKAEVNDLLVRLGEPPRYRMVNSAHP